MSEVNCPLGIPLSEIEDEPWYDEFRKWHNGQTGAICDGREYDHDLGRYVNTPCMGAPHGYVVYGDDLARFLYDWMV